MSEKHLRPLQFIPFYLLWIISAVVSVIDWLVLRAGVTAVAAVLANAVPMDWQIENNWFVRWIVPAVDNVGLIVFGIIAMVSIMAFDYLYRSALIKGTIKKRFIKVTAIQGIILLVGIVLVTISSWVM